ncbi:MAG: pyridoxal-phosphate dependent enzyme [Gammaproteobacteria bacterium]|nr:pyridoxal-phosphate dependent enzyme [Gammaproteobacteria bacterium]
MDTPLHVVTPLLYSKRLELHTGKKVYLKVETLQPSGSFKLRGLGRLCQCYAEDGFEQLVAASGGNAGVAVAYSGMKLGMPTTIFIPSTSHQLFIDEIKLYGATVIVEGKDLDAANTAALKYIEQHHAAYIPPFDHPMIWAGHSTIIDEVVATGLRPDAVVVAVGGGGLACGLLSGMHHHGWTDVPLIAVETEGADSLYQSLQAKKVVPVETVTTRATSLGVKQVAAHLFEWTHEHDIKVVVVKDEDAETGAREFAKDKRIMMELSAGAALSIAYMNHSIIQGYETVLVIACGGVNTSFFW